MKTTFKKVICIALAAVITVCGVIAGVRISRNKSDGKAENTTTTVPTTVDGTGACVVNGHNEPTSKESTTAAETKKENETEPAEESSAVNKPKKTCYAPKIFTSKGDCAEYTIEWHDDNSLKIIDTSYEDNTYYYDVKINEYGEVVSVVNYFIVFEDDSSKHIDKRDFWYVPEYNSEHPLVGAMETGEEGCSDCEWQYIYNSDGQRIKRIYRYEKETLETTYEYNNDGNLVKSFHKDFEPGGGDRAYSYDEYQMRECGLVTGYDGVNIPAFSADEYLKNNKSDSYEKVTKAQHDFFYNTLIYYIIDTSEDVL